MYYCNYPSLVGELLLTADHDCLTGLHFGGQPAGKLAPERFVEVIAQLDGYFSGQLRAFDIPLRLHGTPFQKAVWSALREIGYGQTWSYQQLAEKVGRPTATRAVGATNGRNPISIIIPCHRVIGKDGSLTGYGGGLDRKRLLLELEGKS